MSDPGEQRPRQGVAPKAARLLAAAAVCCALAFLDHDAAADDPEPGVSGSVSIEEGFTDNVRADELRRDDAWYTTLEGEGTWQRKPRGWLPHRIGGLMRTRLYTGYGDRDYAEFGPNFGYDWDLASLTVDYRLSPDHLRVDPASAVAANADVHDLTAELRSKFGKKKRWTALLTFEFDADFYDASFRERSFFEETVEAGLRCRATPMIAPRASFAYSWRDAISSNYDREEATLLFGFDVYFPAEIRGMVRYEKTWRNFIVGYERDAEGHRNNNFGREDDAHAFETGLDLPVPWIDDTTVHLRYRYRDNESTRTERTYDVNEASLRLSYDF